jgi:hypothetical protein
MALLPSTATHVAASAAAVNPVAVNWQAEFRPHAHAAHADTIKTRTEQKIRFIG